jgi:hypothetical protein
VPAKSKRQFGWAGAAFRRGEIDRETLHDYNHGVKGKRYQRLPDHVKSAAKARAATRAAAARRVAEILRRKKRKHR